MSIPFNGFRKIHLMSLDIQNVKETIYIKGVNEYIEGPPPDPALLYFSSVKLSRPGKPQFLSLSNSTEISIPVMSIM
jgi:hypothetical protein